MTASLPHRVWRLVTSARLAVVLIALVGLWSALGSFVPQGSADSANVSAWAAAHPGLAVLASALGLHQAFTAPIFLACVALLALCTAACAWQRTTVAHKRTATLRAALTSDTTSASPGDLQVPLRTGMSAEEALAAVADALRSLGLRPKEGPDRVVANSPRWSVWGSSVFHWALVAVMLLIAFGSLARSSGQIGIAVGESKPDEPASYGLLNEGPLHSFAGIHRVIRVDAFDVSYETGGVRRGPTPTVTVLNAAGETVASQRVYPNHTLKVGSLTIYPFDYGFSANVAILDAEGREVQRHTQLIDFAGNTSDGTAPVDVLVLRDEAGEALYRMIISVPLDEAAGGGFIGRMPEDPRARVVILDADDTPVEDRTLHADETLPLPNGGSLRLLSVDYYARLQLVDDPSVPLLYGAAVIAMLGLGAATLVRQMAFAAWVPEGDGDRVVVRMRLWRTLTVTRGEIEAGIRAALGVNDEGSAS